jgi:hypothetical protein
MSRKVLEIDAGVLKRMTIMHSDIIVWKEVGESYGSIVMRTS